MDRALCWTGEWAVDLMPASQSGGLSLSMVLMFLWSLSDSDARRSGATEVHIRDGRAKIECVIHKDICRDFSPLAVRKRESMETPRTTNMSSRSLMNDQQTV